MSRAVIYMSSAPEMSAAACAGRPARLITREQVMIALEHRSHENSREPTASAQALIIHTGEEVGYEQN
jgi:hypothetical protein